MTVKSKVNFLFPIILVLVILTSSYKNLEPESYNYNKKYSVNKLQADFLQLKKILQDTHPRLYEYTSKEEFDILFDSLYNNLNRKMTEREFQYFLTPIIGKIHCSHTKLLPSNHLSENLDDFISAPPFKLYFANDKAFLLCNYSSDSLIHIGAEILSINGMKTKNIIANFASRIHNEGRNTTFIYNRLNVAQYGLFPAICDYPQIENYELKYINPNSSKIQTISLKSIKQNEYAKYNPPLHNYSFDLYDSLNTAIIKINSFKFKIDSTYLEFMRESFQTIKFKQIKNLIVDVRGNIGGLAEPSAELLRNISSKEFSYFNKKVSWEFNNAISPSENCFTGNVYFLIDGGCRSTTGHFISLAKYHNLGKVIGEETCGSFSCNSNGRPYTLTNTKLIIECPYTTFDVAVQGQVRGNGIIPDIYIKPTIDNVIKGKDTVLIFTLNEIRQMEKKLSR